MSAHAVCQNEQERKSLKCLEQKPESVPRVEPLKWPFRQRLRKDLVNEDHFLGLTMELANERRGLKSFIVSNLSSLPPLLAAFSCCLSLSIHENSPAVSLTDLGDEPQSQQVAEISEKKLFQLCSSNGKFG